MTSCKTRLSGCRDTASIEEGALGCIESFEGARVACVGRFPDASDTAFLACVEAARREAVTCRADYLRSVRENAKRTGICRKRFDICRRACPTTVRINVQQCRVQAVDAHAACLARCADDQRAARELCAGRELACVSSCDGGLQACDDSVEGGYSIFACKVAYREALEACRALGSPPSCIAAAKDAAFNCAGPIYDSAAAAFVGCDLAFDGCVDACPPS